MQPYNYVQQLRGSGPSRIQPSNLYKNYRSNQAKEKLKVLSGADTYDYDAWSDFMIEYPEFQEQTIMAQNAMKLKNDKSSKNLLLRVKNAIKYRKSPEVAAKLLRNYGKSL